MKKISFVFILLLSVLAAESQTAGQLKVTFTTVAYGGTYSPKNVLAVWVESKTGAFVKTLLADAATREAYLTNWRTATSASFNVTDAITGATQGSHGTYTCTWSGTNLTGTVLGDDTYTLAMEMDEGGSGKYTTFLFKKSGTVQTVTSTGVPGFININIKWTPVSTAIENVNADQLIQVYPNPAVSSIYIAGNNVSEVQVCSLSGKVLISSKAQTLNIGNLAKGFYLVLIYSNHGMSVRKIEKL